MDYKDLIVTTIEEIKDHKKKIEGRIIVGSLEDFSHYKYLQGQVRGLQDAIDIYTKVLQGGN
jgi:hypothetical protein